MSFSQRVSKIEIIPIDIPYKRPFRVSFGGVVPGNFVVLKIITNEGVEGIGSSTGFMSANGQTRESAMALMKDISAEVLLGQDPLKTDLLLSRVEGRILQNWPVLAHFDYALYDLKGKILNIPVYQLLGGLCREKIPLECIVMMDDPEVQAEVASEYIKAGFHSIKMHVGPEPKLAVKRFKTVRDAVGPDIPIAIDMAGVYGARNALGVIEELAQHGLNFAEDASSPYDMDGLVDIRRRTNVPLVADLIARSVIEARNVIKRRAADSFHCLLGRTGGIRRALKYTTLIEAEDLDYQICTLGTGIEHAAGAHFAVSRTKKERLNDELGLIFYLHGGTETKDITADVTKEISGRIEKGFLYPPDGPGLGFELNEEMVKKYAAPGINKIIVE
jgi:L-alanine-DL-glutamate epimerase-like enolase superfamily enzyme